MRVYRAQEPHALRVSFRRSLIEIWSLVNLQLVHFGTAGRDDLFWHGTVNINVRSVTSGSLHFVNKVRVRICVKRMKSFELTLPAVIGDTWGRFYKQ